MLSHFKSNYLCKIIEQTSLVTLLFHCIVILNSCIVRLLTRKKIMKKEPCIIPGLIPYGFRCYVKLINIIYAFFLTGNKIQELKLIKLKKSNKIKNLLQKEPQGYEYLCKIIQN